MPIRVEVYTAGGIATGVVDKVGQLREILDSAPELTVEQGQWLPIDGSGGVPAGRVSLAVDDLLLVVAEEADILPVHAQWHSIELDTGPYRVNGELPTMPGFDPGRALARPSGEFIALRDARIELIGRPEAGEATCSHVLVNRYTVDRIAADLMLGFFFPGAAMTMTDLGATEVGIPVVDAAAAADSVGTSSA